MQLGCSTSQLVDKLYASAKGLPAQTHGQPKSSHVGESILLRDNHEELMS
jgi:hypothetical protein